MFLEEQPGYVDVPTLNRIHKGGEATPVSAVWFILTPGAQTQNKREKLPLGTEWTVVDA